MIRAMWKYNYINHVDIIEKFRRKSLYNKINIYSKLEYPEIYIGK